MLSSLILSSKTTREFFFFFGPGNAGTKIWIQSLFVCFWTRDMRPSHRRVWIHPHPNSLLNIFNNVAIYLYIFFLHFHAFSSESLSLSVSLAPTEFLREEVVVLLTAQFITLFNQTALEVSQPAGFPHPSAGVPQRSPAFPSVPGDGARSLIRL